MQLSDEESLIQGLLARQPQALERFYDSSSKRAFGLAYRITSDYFLSEEIVQEAFLAIWQQAGKLRPNASHLLPLLLTVVHHKAIDGLRHRRGQPALFSQFELSLPSRQEDASELAIAAIDRDSVLKALESIAPEQRQTILMAYFSGYTHTEIAAAMGVPLGTVKSRLRIALEHMRSLLQEVSGP